MNSYKKLCTEFYDIDKPNAPQDKLDFYTQYAKQANGPILEPMSGSGRFLIPLLKQGFDIDGIDASPEMLQACHNHFKQLGLTTEIQEQYLHELVLPRQYNLVIIPEGSFCLITDPAQIRESLKRIHAQMLPGAKFIVEIEQAQTQESHSWPWGGRWVERPDGAKIIISWLGSYNAEEQISRDIHRYELIKDGNLLTTEFEDFALRYYRQAEFRDLLTASGFQDIRVYKADQFSKPSDTDGSIVFECSKA